MFNLKRILTLLITAVLALGATGVTAAEDIPGFEAGIDVISQYGNIILNIAGSRILSLGYGYGDLVTAEINGHAVDMPIGSNYSDVDSGKPVLRIFVDEGKEIDMAILGMLMGDYATTYGVAMKTVIEEEPGYRWEYDPQTAITVALLEKGGYLDEYQLRQMRYTNDRSDYPQLTDEEYANFRAVTTTGIPRGALYRSSSPINPRNNRNTYADEALNNNGIQTVLNLADTEASMKAFEGYAYTYYAQRDVIAVNLGADFTSDSCKAGLRDALGLPGRARRPLPGALPRRQGSGRLCLRDIGMPGGREHGRGHCGLCNVLQKLLRCRDRLEKI